MFTFSLHLYEDCTAFLGQLVLEIWLEIAKLMQWCKDAAEIHSNSFTGRNAKEFNISNLSSK
jgi:hypothetical protein